jgi:hypothetical protein
LCDAPAESTPPRAADRRSPQANRLKAKATIEPCSSLLAVRLVVTRAVDRPGRPEDSSGPTRRTTHQTLGWPCCPRLNATSRGACSFHPGHEQGEVDLNRSRVGHPCFRRTSFDLRGRTRRFGIPAHPETHQRSVTRRILPDHLLRRRTRGKSSRRFHDCTGPDGMNGCAMLAPLRGKHAERDAAWQSPRACFSWNSTMNRVESRGQACPAKPVQAWHSG